MEITEILAMKNGGIFLGSVRWQNQINIKMNELESIKLLY